MFESYKKLVALSDLLQHVLQLDRVHAQVAILLFGVWCGWLAGKRGFWAPLGAFTLFEHAVSWGGLLVMGWLIRREDVARHAEAYGDDR